MEKLKLSFLVFSETKQLSKTLQSSSITAQEAYAAAAAVKCFLKRQRMESSFEYFYRTVVKELKNLNNAFHFTYLGRNAFQ